MKLEMLHASCGCWYKKSEDMAVGVRMPPYSASLLLCVQCTLWAAFINEGGRNLEETLQALLCVSLTGQAAIQLGLQAPVCLRMMWLLPVAAIPSFALI